MSKNTINKAHLQQKSLASKIWQQVKRHFHKTNSHVTDNNNSDIDISNAAIVAIQHDLTLIDENLDTSKPQRATENSKDYTEFEVEITLNELQDALYLLEQKNQKVVSADEALKELIDTLKKAETSSENTLKNESEKPEIEVIVEFVPLSSLTNNSVASKTVYKEIHTESINDKIKREKEQRELAKRITHYPPSDRLH